MDFVYNFLNLIPKGKVVSYKQLGKIFNLHPRTIAKTLQENKQQNYYPCYKVVNSDGNLGGYNLGINEKIKRLEQDSIVIKNNKIDKDFFWKMNLKNFFCAFPLEGKQVEKFKAMVKELEKINNGSFSLQKADTPHITLRFFGNIDLEDFYKIVETSGNIEVKGKKYIIFNKLDHFSQKVYFLKSDYNKDLIDIYNDFQKINNLEKQIRGYHPHLTIARIKNEEKFLKIKKQFEEIVSNYSFYIKLNKIRFYLAVDNHFQIPVKDVIIKVF